MGVVLTIGEGPGADPATHVAFTAINVAGTPPRSGNVVAATFRVAVIPYTDDLAAPAVAERVDDAA